jgi:hypothetical protein
MGLPLLVVFLAPATPGEPPQARSDAATPAFEQFGFRIDGRRGHPSERLRIESDGHCWYTVARREARGGTPVRSGAVIGHMLSPARFQRLARLWEGTGWLTVKGPEGLQPAMDAEVFTLTRKREGEELSVVCHLGWPEPYSSLLKELRGLATQERRVYLHDYVSGRAGTEAWQEIARELAALRGECYSKSPVPIEYERYLPIASRIIRNFQGENDDELIPAVRLAGHFRLESELPFLHRMAYDRSSHLVMELAWALGRIHDRESLPVLVGMASRGGGFGFDLIKWGDDAVPHIVSLIGLSTDDRLDGQGNAIGEFMIRAYLDHWNELDQPIDARVVAAVRKALESKKPENGLIRTEYHREFLKRMAMVKAGGDTRGASPASDRQGR